MVNANITESNHIGIVRIKDEARMRYNPLKNLTPQKITATLLSDSALSSGSVTEVLQKGYTLNGKVIRPSMVKVNN